MKASEFARHLNQSKLIRLLSVFSDSDREKLSAFVKSPYFNKNQHLSALLDYFLPFAPTFQDEVISFRGAYAAVFRQTAGEEEAKAVITKLSSKLVQLCRQFIEQEQLHEMPFLAAYFRKKWFRKNSEPDWEEEALRQMRLSNVENQVYDGFKALCEYLTEEEAVQMTASSELVLEKFDLSALNRSLDKYYIHEKLVTLCHIANHSLIANQKYKLPEIEQILELAIQRKEELPPATWMWSNALHLLREPSSKMYYHLLRQDWEKNTSILSTIDNNAIFQYLLNAARFAFPKSEEYYPEMFELYRYQIDSGNLLQHGRIVPEVFYNIVTLAAGLNKLDWAFQFFNQYKGKLDPGNKKSEGIQCLCECLLYFEQSKYEKALETLNTAFFSDIQFKLTERRMRIKIYTELEYEQLLSDQINAFRKFISVNKSIIPDHHRIGNLAFLNAASLIWKMAFDRKDAKLKLEALIAESPIMPEKKWLLGKISA